MVDIFTGTVPNLTQSQPNFDTNTQAILDYIGNLAPQLNEWVGAYVQDTSSTSITSNAIGTGSKSFTVEAGKGYKVNMPVRASATTGNYMDGIVTAYSGTSLTVNFSSFTGSGTFTSWNIFLTVPGSGVTLGSNTFTGDQFVPDDAYDAIDWNGNNSAPTKNAIRDKIEALISGLAALETTASDPTYVSTSSVKASTPQWVRGYVSSLDKTVISSAALSNPSLDTLAHGLGRVPVIMAISLVFQSAVSNWSIGDEIFNWVDGVTGLTDSFISVGAGGTNILISCKSPSIATFDKVTNANVAIDVGNFKVKVYYR